MKKTLIIIKNKIMWNLERILIKNKKKKLKSGLPEGEKIILAPHSDDEWIGCSQIIKNEKDTIIINMNMSGNDKEDIHIKRYNEMLFTSKKFNIEMITLKDDKISHLKNIIKERLPQFICVPYYIDWHEEHIEVMNILKKALKDNENLDILMYQVSLPIYLEEITNYMILNKKEWKYKWNHFKTTYRTQENFPYYRFATNERINGKSFGCYAAEVYCIISSNEWCKNLYRNILTNDQRNNVKRTLFSINKTRKYLNNINNSIERKD